MSILICHLQEYAYSLQITKCDRANVMSCIESMAISSCKD